MHEQHPVFLPPEDPDAALWRYMDLPKLVALLTRKTLWFARADTLGDPHEGAFGEFNQRTRPHVYQDVPEDQLSGLSNYYRLLTKYTFVNCWHLSEVESAAMWSLYTPLGQGVAVRSTYSRLTESLRVDEQVFVGRVKYVDPATEWIPEGNLLYPFVHKRRSFAHEREVRAVVQRPPQTTSSGEDAPAGLDVEVDVDCLVESVFVAPGQPGWFKAVVQDVVEAFVANRIPVHQSDMDRAPIY